LVVPGVWTVPSALSDRVVVSIHASRPMVIPKREALHDITTVPGDRYWTLVQSRGGGLAERIDTPGHAALSRPVFHHRVCETHYIQF